MKDKMCAIPVTLENYAWTRFCNFLEVQKENKRGRGGRTLPSTPGQCHDNLLSAHNNEMLSSYVQFAAFFGQTAVRPTLFVAAFSTALWNILSLLCSCASTLPGWSAVLARVPRSQTSALSNCASPLTRYECSVAVFIHHYIFHSRRKRFHFGTFDKVVSFRLHFLLAQNQCYGWYYKPFLLRSDKTGKCALKSAVLTPVSSYLIQFTWNSMVNLTCFLLYFFLAVATNASCPLLAYCNCSCVSAGLLRFRDNLRKHLGLSAPVVLRNARRVPLQIFTSADTE